MDWDAELNKSISAIETLCQDIENISFFQKITDQHSLTTLASHPLVNFDNLTVYFPGQSPQAQGLLSTSYPTTTFTPTTQDASSVNTSSSTCLLFQQLQAQVQALSETPFF